MLLYTVCAHDRSILVMNVTPQSPHHQLDEALNSWLGADLSTLEHDGQPVWNGDPDALHARAATVDEAATWRRRQEMPEDAAAPVPVYLVAASRLAVAASPR